MLDLADLGQDSAAVEELAARLPGHGARVAIVAPNEPVLRTALLAAWRAGAVPVPLSARLREDDLGRILTDADPALVLSVAEHRGYSFAEFARGSELPWLVLGQDGIGQVAEDTEPCDPDVGAVPYTSRTTGGAQAGL